ncbi:trifunctional transcriptional regulator/proline dehydrogenase/pyrroline-5-carboxylate dehydrogenase [Escherichia coli]|uniref:Trifunctional transcriptional regulator/proline dehydrogenase/pyrroline-5-carboxylate dehydrogenase n=1 Tax=Escherichia coli TaxID=562 RepID=A0A376ZUI9_ECOLX|nr:trifunctional transcriptional regulator/proline dehydrogenase/pyrroline-5-carboxylate dehydrogenase [Escherichia coli]
MLPGPTGERNTWTLLPRERVLCIADDEQDALTQLAAVLAVGSQVLWPDDALHRQLVRHCHRQSANVFNWRKRKI